MKAKIASLLRHAFTALAGLGGFLLSKGLIDQGDVSAVDAAGVSLGNALVVIITAVIGRLLLTLTAKIFRHGSGEMEDAGSSGGMGLLFVIGTMAVIAGSLPSCSSTEWPVTGSIMYRDPNSGAKGGLTFSPGSAPVASVKVPIYDPQSGAMIGLADLQTSFPRLDRKSAK